MPWKDMEMGRDFRILGGGGGRDSLDNHYWAKGVHLYTPFPSVSAGLAKVTPKERLKS